MKRIVFILLPVGFLTLAALTFVLASTPQAAKSYEAAYSPQQPLPSFSHKIHAGNLGMDCQYCHIYARRSWSSGVPVVQTCYNCHKVVEGVSEQGKQDVQKIRDAYVNNTPIEWVKVHDLQDFTKFPHRAHLKIGEELALVGEQGFTCQNCHGPVQEMGAAELRAFDPELGEVPLTMGWCLTCHINKHEDVALIDKLKATAYEQGVAWTSLIGRVEVTQAEKDATKARLRDCSICHY